MSKKRHYTQQQLAIIRRNYANKNNAPVVNELIDMHLAKIRNRYIFNSTNPLGEHTYAVYVDTDSGEVRAIPTTHLYVPDKQNMAKLDKGLLHKVKFAGYETPSGVENYFHNADCNGKPLNLNHSDVRVDKTALPQRQAQIIKSFARFLRK